MNNSTTSNINASNAMHPIQRATIEEIVEHYLDHPQASWLLGNYWNNAMSHCDNAASEKAMQALDRLKEYYLEHPHPLSVLHDRVQNDPSRMIREAAVDSIAKHYANDPQTYDWLCEQAQTAKDMDVQYRALTALGDYFSHKPQTLTLLRELYQNSENDAIRETALRQIAQHFSNDPQTIVLLQTCIRNASEPTNLREEALWQIADRYHDDSQTLPLLHNYLQQQDTQRNTAFNQLLQCYEENEEVIAALKKYALDLSIWNLSWKIRCYDHPREIEDALRKQNALRNILLSALAEYYPDDPQTIPTLHKYARQRCEAAIRRLINFPRHPETLAILCDRAQAMIDESDYDYDAFRSLVKEYRDHPQALSMLTELIQKLLNKEFLGNLDESVAGFALDLLIKYYSDNPETLPFLLSSVELRDHTFAEVERYMMGLAVRNYRDDSRILPFLKRIAQNHSNKYLRTSALCYMAWNDFECSCYSILSSVRRDRAPFTRQCYTL